MKNKILTALPLSLLLLPAVALFWFWPAAFNFRWYQKEFTLYQINDQFAAERLNTQTQNLFGYLQNKNDLEKSYYTKREITHLLDVRNILQVWRWLTLLFYLALAVYLIIILSRRGGKVLLSNIYFACLLAGIFLVVILLLSLLSFSRLFIIFHLILFRNDFWQLDPAKDFLINIFRENIFFDFFKILAVESLLTLLLLGLTVKIASRFITKKTGPG